MTQHASSTWCPQSDKLADYLLHQSRERGDALTPLKLQKLMFYADAWHMALYDEELTPEKFEAWVHGPVARSQYGRFREYQWRPIMTDVTLPKYSTKVRDHLEEVLDIFGVETGSALERMTHSERPWLHARNGLASDAASGAKIDKKITAEFYRSLAEAEEE